MCELGHKPGEQKQTGTLGAADDLGRYVSRGCRFSGCREVEVGAWGGSAQGYAHPDIYTKSHHRGGSPKQLSIMSGDTYHFPPSRERHVVQMSMESGGRQFISALKFGLFICLPLCNNIILVRAQKRNA